MKSGYVIRAMKYRFMSSEFEAQIQHKKIICANNHIFKEKLLICTASISVACLVKQ